MHVGLDLERQAPLVEVADDGAHTVRPTSGRTNCMPDHGYAA